MGTNLEIKGVTITTQIYALGMLELGILGLPALKALRAIIGLEKKELPMKKPVEEPEFASAPKSRRVLLNRGGVIKPWAENILQRKVSQNLSENMEDWLVENKCININQSDCLFPARLIANVSNNSIPIRVANCYSQMVQFRKRSLLAFAEEVSKIPNTEMDDKGNKTNKGLF